MMRKLNFWNELSTVRLTGTRLAALMMRWPSGDSTKSAKSSAACGCGACFARAMPSARPNAGGKGLTWTEDVLLKYLENPLTFMPGTKMAFAGLKDEQDRKDLIAFLKKHTKK